MSPTVSVIMPTYNRASLLPKAIDSVLSQTYSEIELIVVNDGSTDNTEEALEPYIDKITYIKKANGGCADAKNVGVKVAKGEYITHLDDDDLMMPTRIERLVQCFEQHPHIGLCASSAFFIDKDGNVIGRKPLRNVPQKTRLLHLLLTHLAVQSNMMLPREVFEEVGPYIRRWCEDYDLWYKVLRRYEMHAIEEPLVQYRRHDNQMTSPKYHVPHMIALKCMNHDYIMLTPIDKLIPDLQNEAVGRAILGALLARHKLFNEATRELRKSPDDGTRQLWFAMLLLIHQQFNGAKRYFEQVPQSHPCCVYVPEALSLIDKTEKICQSTAAKDNDKIEVVQLRKEIQRVHLRLFNETLRMATGGKTCLKD